MNHKTGKKEELARSLGEDTIRELIRTALNMRNNSYCPYSEFSVGAALLTGGGKIYGGCNIENAAYPDTICAERTAIFKAVSEGEREMRAIAVTGGKGEMPDGYSVPCGSCRQVMGEFCDPDSFLIIVARSTEDYRVYTLEEMLPFSFGITDLV